MLVTIRLALIVLLSISLTKHSTFTTVNCNILRYQIAKYLVAETWVREYLTNLQLVSI